MATKTPKKKITTVHKHPRHVPVSQKNPSGTTIVDEHIRRVPGTYLDLNEILSIAKNYNRKEINFPTTGKLEEYPDADKYDETIAIWTDYFNKKFGANPPLDPDVVKALIGSESGFDADPKANKTAFGIAQITKQTLKILQDPKGETKDFIFNKIRLKDLKNPDVAIPMAIRWLFKKKDMAERKLKRSPTNEEIILEYKGLLKSKTPWRNNGLESYSKKFRDLKSK
jgi:hypothetical protein